MKTPVLLATLAFLVGLSAAETPKSICDSDCPNVFTPLCGSDGTTYMNQCVLDFSACENPSLNITKVNDGECVRTPKPTRPLCISDCPNVFTPLCGSDGTTYPNQCVLDFSACENPSLNITKVGDGECERTTKPTKPTCDSACQHDLLKKDGAFRPRRSRQGIPDFS